MHTLDKSPSSEAGERPPLLEVSHLEASYGHLQVLWGVSLKIQQGQFVVLLGPNGAGKTTTMRAISGMLKPKGGDVLFMGRSIAHLPAHEIVRAGISSITEELDLFLGMSVRENLLLGAYGSKQPPEKKQEAMDYVLHLLPILAERQRQLAITLSGGERKMLALGRGLMSDPKLLLVDEPSLGLAPKVVEAVFDALQQLNRRGVSILLVEQAIDMSMRVSDYCYFLDQGRTVLEGASATLRQSERVKEVYFGERS